MVRGGRHDVGVYLDVASAFATDTSSAVVDTIAGRLAVIAEDLVSAADQPAYQSWIRSHFGKQLNALGLPGDVKDNDETQMRRATLLTLVGITGNDPDVQKRSRELAEQYLKDPGSLPATLAPTVLTVAAMGGDRALYDQYLGKLGTLAAQPEQYYRLLERALLVQGSGSCQAHARVRGLTGGSHAGHGHRPGQHAGAPVEPGDDVGVRANELADDPEEPRRVPGDPFHRRIPWRVLFGRSRPRSPQLLREEPGPLVTARPATGDRAD